MVDPVAGGEEAAPVAAKKAKGKAKKNDDSFGGPERSLVGLLTEQLINGAANRAGKPPRWVSLGLAAYAAEKVEGSSPYYRRLRETALTEVRIGWQVKATEALGGQAPAENTRAVGFALFEWIAGNASGPQLNAFIRTMLDGQEKLDEAITGCLGLSVVRFEPGADLPEHAHPHEQMGLLLSGRLEFTIGGETALLEAGDIWRIPGSVPHSARALDGPVVALDVFHPVRDDYR